MQTERSVVVIITTPLSGQEAIGRLLEACILADQKSPRTNSGARSSVRPCVSTHAVLSATQLPPANVTNLSIIASHVLRGARDGHERDDSRKEGVLGCFRNMDHKDERRLGER